MKTTSTFLLSLVAQASRLWGQTQARRLCYLSLVGLLLLVPQVAAAKDEPLDFLHTMQERGFADLAIEYLKGIKDDPDAPKEIIDVWDMEMSRCYKAAAKDAYSDKERKFDEEQQKLYLDKFIKENPNRPEALTAAADVADEEAKAAVLDLARAKITADPKEKADLIEKARKTLADVRPRFIAAAESMTKRLKEADPKKTSKRKIEELRLHIVENKLNAIIVDFYMAVSYPDGSNEHSTLLGKASKAFDDLFQETRETQTWIALNAHYWQGMVLQDLKKYKDALAVYEEVLAGDSDVPDATATNSRSEVMRARAKTGMEDFFAEVQVHYLQCLKIQSLKQYVQEAVEWRRTHKATSDKTAGYQTLTLELAKTYVEQSEKQGADKPGLVKRAVELLTEMLKVDSPSRLEATKLRKLLKPGGSEDDSFDELLAEGDEALKKTPPDYAKAIDCFEKALAHPPPKTDKAKLDRVRGAVAVCIFYQAREAYAAKKVEDAKELLTRLLKDKDYRETPIAPPAAKFKLDILVYEYSLASEKDDEAKKAKKELGDKLTKFANAIAAMWPGKPEADAARLILMKLALLDNKLDEAFALLQKMNPKSELYGTALHLMGASYWQAYIQEKLKIKDLEVQKLAVAPELKTKRDADRSTAMKTMRDARDRLSSILAPGSRFSPTLVNAQFALARMCVEGGDFKEAAVLYGELIADIQKNDKPTIDDLTLKIFNGAVTTYLQVPDIDKAAAVSSMLLKLGPDEKVVNFSLMSFARTLETERKSLVHKLETAPDTQAADFRAKRDSYAKLLEDLLKSLSTREKLEPRDLVWIANTAGLMGLDGLASELAKKILEKYTSKSDSEFNEQVEKAVPLLETLLVDIEARQSKFDEAITHVDALIEKFPKALKPLQTKAEIYEKWAKKDPARYDDAIKQWNSIRAKLQRVKPDKDGCKMPEFYDATYREAKCLFDVAQKTSDKQKAIQGLQILQQVLMFDPKFTGKKHGNNYQQYTNFVELSNKLAELAGVDLTKKSASTDK